MRKVETKFCSRCGQWKPLSEFGKDASRTSGIQTCCKECQREKVRAVRQRRKAEKEGVKGPQVDGLLTECQDRRNEAIHKLYGLLAKKAKQKGTLSSEDSKMEDECLETIRQCDYKLEQLQQNPTNTIQQPVKEKGIMTKEKLIELLNSVPAGAQVIHVSDTESQSSLVAVWANESGDTIIRRMVDKMPYICAEGNLFSLVSGGITKVKEE